MKISIITPCYNSEKYIRETIESVISQRGEFEIEYIIVDGGSTDKTIGIIEKYIIDISSKEFSIKCNHVDLRLISEPDQGMYDALVKGLKIATGDIMAYINSDDIYSPKAFSAVMEIFRDYPKIDWLTGMLLIFNEKGQTTNFIRPLRYDSALIRKGIYGTILPFIKQESTFWRKEMINKLDYERLKKYKYAGDYYIWHTFSKTAYLFTAECCFAGFRNRKDQLSKMKTCYFKEFYDIAGKRSVADMIKAYLYLITNYIMLNKYKRLFNKNTIYYNHENNKWEYAGKML
jgi:glycosyltransferase involved in cell wall biosynthesis